MTFKKILKINFLKTRNTYQTIKFLYPLMDGDLIYLFFDKTDYEQ